MHYTKQLSGESSLHCSYVTLASLLRQEVSWGGSGGGGDCCSINKCRLHARSRCCRCCSHATLECNHCTIAALSCMHRCGRNQRSARKRHFPGGFVVCLNTAVDKLPGCGDRPGFPSRKCELTESFSEWQQVLSNGTKIIIPLSGVLSGVV